MNELEFTGDTNGTSVSEVKSLLARERNRNLLSRLECPAACGGNLYSLCVRGRDRWKSGYGSTPARHAGKEIKTMTAKFKTAVDNSLHANVQSEIEFDPESKSTDIHVAAQDGVVSLTGFVHSYPEKFAAEAAAKRVYGAC